MLEKQSVQTNVRVLLSFVAALIVAIVLSATLHSSAYAAGANTLKVTPVRSDIEVKPGESKIVEVTITNITGSPITVSPIENDFVSGDERGTPALILDANTFAPTHSLKRFLSPLTDTTIPAGKSTTIKVVVTVPKTAQAGGYFGAIRFAPADPDGGGQVNLSASVASLILLTVPGNVVEKLELTDFSLLQNGRNATNFNTPDNIQATFRFENKGNLQIGPFGKISVSKGNTVLSSIDFNNQTPRDVILPDGARRWDVPLEKIGTFGHYTVNATLTYGASNQTIDISKSFWVIPLFVIYAAIGLVIILVGLIVMLVVMFKKKRGIFRGRNRRRSNFRIR